MDNAKEVEYAGFFTRLLAILIDLFFLLSFISFLKIPTQSSIFVLLLIWWIYTTVMIVTWKATIGGKILGIAVVDNNLESLSLQWALLRFFISIIPFALYLVMRGMQHAMVLAPSPNIQMLPQLLFILPPLIMFFMPKRKMLHDLFTRSIVIDTAETKRKNTTEEKDFFYIVQRAIRVVGTLIFLVVSGYFVVYTSIFYSIGQKSHKAYNSSFSQHYSVNDYNDSKIIFYNKELEKYTQSFIDAEGMYDIFEADVKKDFALNCIDFFLKEHNESNWIEIGSHFRKNARNKYAKTQETIKKAKINESHMGKYFYYYDTNDVNHIEEEIVDIWDKDGNKESCQKMLPVEQMYEMFIIKYIKNRENALASDKNSYKYATGKVLGKDFYQKEIKKTAAWLEILYQKHPNYIKP